MRTYELGLPMLGKIAYLAVEMFPGEEVVVLASPSVFRRLLGDLVWGDYLHKTPEVSASHISVPGVPVVYLSKRVGFLEVVRASDLAAAGTDTVVAQGTIS